MTAPVFHSLEQAVADYNKGHGFKIKPHRYQTRQELAAAGFGKTILASYDQAKGWKFERISCVFCRWIIRLIRYSVTFSKLFGYRDTLLTKAKRQELVALLTVSVASQSLPVVQPIEEPSRSPEPSPKAASTPKKRKMGPDTINLQQQLGCTQEELMTALKVAKDLGAVLYKIYRVEKEISEYEEQLDAASFEYRSSCSSKEKTEKVLAEEAEEDREKEESSEASQEMSESSAFVDIAQEYLHVIDIKSKLKSANENLSQLKEQLEEISKNELAIELLRRMG